MLSHPCSRGLSSRCESACSVGTKREESQGDDRIEQLESMPEGVTVWTVWTGPEHSNRQPGCYPYSSSSSHLLREIALKRSCDTLNREAFSLLADVSVLLCVPALNPLGLSPTKSHGRSGTSRIKLFLTSGLLCISHAQKRCMIPVNDMIMH